MNLIIFVLINLILSIIVSKMFRSIINPFNLMALPYVFLVVLNNTVFISNGFNVINGFALNIITLALFMFFIGLIFVPRIKTKNDNYQKTKQHYNFKALSIYTVIVEGLVIIRALLVINRFGFSWLTSDVNEGFLMSGIIGHLLLTLYITIPIIFTKWLSDKSKLVYLIISLFGLLSMFLTFVKYHSICLVVVIYLYSCSQNRKYIHKGMLLIISLSILLFVGNYLVTFWSRNAIQSVDSNFYLRHLWKYVGGSVINDNNILSNRINYNVSIMFKIASFIFPLPNMIFSIFGINPLFQKPGLPMIPVSSNGESSNVVDLIGYLYPSNNSFIEIILFCVFFVVFGFISGIIFKFCFKKNSSLQLFASIYLTFFCFFSFFGVYSTLSTPWELLVESLILPLFFNGKIVINQNKSKGGYV